MRSLKIKVIISRKHLRYFKENWGAPFIIAFMGLLVSAAGHLAMGFEAMANELAIYAYYALVIGVILQIASYIKYEEKD